MIRAVIFDMDGVLIDSHPVALAMMRECAARNTIPLDDGDYRAWLRLSARPFWEAMIEKHALPHDSDFYIADYNIDEEIRRYAILAPIPGVVALIQRFAAEGLLLAVATSAAERRAAAVVAQFGLADYLATIVSANDVQNHKPHGDVYREAARRLGVPPDLCLAIEDTCPGVEAARSAGMQVVGYVGAGSAGERLVEAQWICENFANLTLDSLR